MTIAILESLGIAPGYSERYYECHITIDPVFEDQLKNLERLCIDNHFRVAKLLMQKRAEDTPERSKYDTFMTGRDREFTKLKNRTMKMVAEILADGNYIVRRVKIEDTLFDTNCGDRVWNV